jgi:hypothetical protein
MVRKAGPSQPKRENQDKPARSKVSSNCRLRGELIGAKPKRIADKVVVELNEAAEGGQRVDEAVKLLALFGFHELGFFEFVPLSLRNLAVRRGQ